MFAERCRCAHSEVESAPAAQSRTTGLKTNLATALEGAGSSISQLVQVRVYLADIEHWPSFNQIYADWAGDARPARAIVPVGPLHFGFKIEIEATAMV